MSINRQALEVSGYAAVVEKCNDTGFYVGYIPGLPGAHSQAETLDELDAKLAEVVAMILEDDQEPATP